MAEDTDSAAALRLKQSERDTYLEAARYLVRYVVPVRELQRLAARWPFLLPDDCQIEEEEEVLHG